VIVLLRYEAAAALHTIKILYIENISIFCYSDSGLYLKNKNQIFPDFSGLLHSSVPPICLPGIHNILRGLESPIDVPALLHREGVSVGVAPLPHGCSGHTGVTLAVCQAVRDTYYGGLSALET